MSTEENAARRRRRQRNVPDSRRRARSRQAAVIHQRAPRLAELLLTSSYGASSQRARG
jgi:hypothetical protein